MKFLYPVLTFYQTRMEIIYRQKIPDLWVVCQDYHCFGGVDLFDIHLRSVTTKPVTLARVGLISVRHVQTYPDERGIDDDTNHYTEHWDIVKMIWNRIVLNACKTLQIQEHVTHWLSVQYGI